VPLEPQRCAAWTIWFRLAICEAERSPDVAETLYASHSVIRNALADLLAQAQAAGILGHGDPQQMMEQFFGLLWGDLMLGRLLGVADVPTPEDIQARARDAAQAFLDINGYGRREPPCNREWPLPELVPGIPMWTAPGLQD
jgi:hypothetical protein